jgi:hypothetical protein
LVSAFASSVIRCQRGISDMDLGGWRHCGYHYEAGGRLIKVPIWQTSIPISNSRGGWRSRDSPKPLSRNDRPWTLNSDLEPTPPW